MSQVKKRKNFLKLLITHSPSVWEPSHIGIHWNWTVDKQAVQKGLLLRESLEEIPACKDCVEDIAPKIIYIKTECFSFAMRKLQFFDRVNGGTLQKFVANIDFLTKIYKDIKKTLK